MGDEDNHECDSKLTNINCSHAYVKEEVILPDDISDGESTLSDNEKSSDVKMRECLICLKYRSMFIILRNHDCLLENNEKCQYCAEIYHWTDCFKNHVNSHQIKKESEYFSDSTVSDKEANSSDSTASDNEEIEKLLSPIENLEQENCQICLKYQGMFIILEENHVCDFENSNKNCGKCEEIIQWYKCFDEHKKTHFLVGRNAENDNPNCKPLQFHGKFDCGICLKLNSIVTNLVKNHKCENRKLCSVCKEVSFWLSCLKNHKQSDSVLEHSGSEDSKDLKGLQQETDCAICSKIHSTLINLNNHDCHQRRGNGKCKICQELSFWLENFKAHEKHHKNQVSSPRKFFSCSTCGKRFSGEKMLNVHKSYCTNSNFTCDICHRKFPDMFLLKKHKVFQLCRNSPVSLQSKYKACEKAFPNFSDNGEEPDLKLYKCAKQHNEIKTEIF